MKITNNYYYYLLFILTQLMSVRFFFNFHLTNEYPLIIFYIYFFVSFLIFWVLFNYKIIKKITKSLNLFYLIIFIFTLYIFYKYPLSIGTERDDCYKILLSNLSYFNFPYSKTELGDPCSTGLSTLIFYFPVLIYENYFSLTASLYFLIFYFFLKNYLKKSVLIFLIYIQLFNLLYLEEAIAGSDFFFISISYLIGIISLNNYFQNNKISQFIIAFVMLYFFYGSRIVFIFLIPINYIFFIINYEIKKVNKFFIFQSFFSLITILIPMLINYNGYHPLHIITKGYGIIGINMIIFIILISLMFILFNILLFYKFETYKLRLLKILKKNNIILQLVFFSLPLLIVVVTTFIHRLNTNMLKNWEGLSYFILIYPSLIFIFSYFFNKEMIFKKII